MPFVLEAARFFLCDVGDVGGSLAPGPFKSDLEVGGEASNADPFNMIPSPSCVVSLVAVCRSGGSALLCTPFDRACPVGVLETLLTKEIFSSSCFVSAMVVTSLALRNPQCCPSSVSSGLSTTTKLARTLLTGRLWTDASERAGDCPRLGGEAGRSSDGLFSNIARRFLTPPVPDMSANRGTGQLWRFVLGWR